MKTNLAVSIIGKDQTGIVAEISKALFETGCNIEDSAMTLLRSEFAMILIISIPAAMRQSAVIDRLTAAAGKMKLSCFIRPLKNAEHTVEKQKGKPWVLSVYGADKPGIVHAVTALLAKQNINITNVQTKIIGTKNKPVYCMFLESFFPAKLSLAPFKSKLSATAARLNVTISINAADYPTL
ncbi:MAG: ACT domain-containing protein [Elusimicrobia bacterium]|nr:ACT domain-containing protein [Elusimicrobiota bacterium]